MASRREFLKVAAGTATAALGLSARSYARIMGSNERVNVAIIGLHGRGYAHLDSLHVTPNAAVTHICDVDSVELGKFAEAVKKKEGRAPVAEWDFRRLLDSRDVDAVTIATPEHWHAPMAILALKAGKHVYVEKPCSHNPHEGELLVAAQRKYGALVQMGSQQRSSPHTIEIVRRIHEGVIGRAYFAESWYSNTRGSIGVGRHVPVPPTLDWELWQGPAPRREYRDNIHPYNWHWFWHWGTGETLNNGTHEVDVCRWALGVDLPSAVTASGGRYHYSDDWEFYDTLLTTFEYDGKMISWEGLSCQGKEYFNRSRGSLIHGTGGSVLVDRDGYQVFSLDNKIIDQFAVGTSSSTHDLVSADAMTDAHFRNFVDAIRTGEPLRAPVAEGNVCVTMLQLSNIAWKVGRTLRLDAATGHILDDPAAAALFSRAYEPGWEPAL